MNITFGFAAPEVAKTSTPALRARLRFAAIIPPSTVPHQCQRVALPAWGRGLRLSLPRMPCSSSEHLHLDPCFEHPCCIVEGGLIPSFSPVGAEACRGFLPQPRQPAVQQPEPKDGQLCLWEGYFRSYLPWYERHMIQMALQPPVVPLLPERASKMHLLGKLARRVNDAIAGSALAELGGANVDTANDPFRSFDSVTDAGVKEMAAPFPKVEIKKANTVSLLMKEVFTAYALKHAPAFKPAPVTARNFEYSRPTLPTANMKSAFSTYGSNDEDEDIESSVYSQSASVNSNLTEAEKTGNVELRALGDGQVKLRRVPGFPDLGYLRNRTTRFSQIPRHSPIVWPAVRQQPKDVSRIVRPVISPTPSPIYLGRPLLLPSPSSGDSLYLSKSLLRGSSTESSINWEANRVDNTFCSPAIRIIGQDDADLESGERLLVASPEPKSWSLNAFFTGRIRARRARRFPNQVKRTVVGWVRRFFMVAFGRCGRARR